MADPDGPHLELSKDRKTIIVSPNSNPLSLDAPNVDALLRNLSELRARMTTKHAPKWNPAIQKFEALYDPAWQAAPEMKGGRSVLHVRHPGFGWLHFSLPKRAAARLSKILRG